MLRISTLCLCAALLGGCAAERPTSATEYLDPVTAVTIRAVATPAIYARDVPALAANARDYLSLGAVELNNMGARKHYLALIAWSTVDRTATRGTAQQIPGRIELEFGGARHELEPVTHDGRSIAVGLPVFRPESGYAGESWYAVSVADLRALATALPATVRLVEPGTDHQTYQLWQGAARELAAFVSETPDPVVSERAPRSPVR